MLDLGPPPAFYERVSLETQKAILPGLTPYPGLIGGSKAFGDSYLVPKKATVGTSVDTAASGATVAVTVTPSEANGTCFIHINERNLNLTSGTANIGVSDALGAVWTQVARNDYSTSGPNRETLLFCADLGAVTARAVTLTLGFASSAVLASPYPMDKGTVVMGSANGTGAAGDVTLTHGDWPTSLAFLASYSASNIGFVAPANPAGGTAAQSWTAISNGWSGTSLNMVACFQSTNRNRSDQFNTTGELSALSGAVVTPFKNGQAAAFTSTGAFTAGGILVGVHKGKVKKSSRTKKATVLSANNYYLDTSGSVTTTVPSIGLGDDTIEDRVIMICAAIENLGTRAPNSAQATLAGVPISQVAYWANEIDNGSIFIGHIPKGTGTSGSLVFIWNAGPTQVNVLFSVWILQGLNFPNALQAWTSGNANGSAVTTYSNDRGFIPDNTLSFRHLLQRTGVYGSTVSAPATMPAGIYTPDVPSQGVHQGPSSGAGVVNNLSTRSNVAVADNQNNALTNITAVQGQTWTSPTASIHKGQSIAVA